MAGTARSQWGDRLGGGSEQVSDAPAVRPTPLSQDELLELFDGSETGAGFELQPATIHSIL